MAIHGKIQLTRVRGKAEMPEKINLKKKACKLASEILADTLNQKRSDGSCKRAINNKPKK